MTRCDACGKAFSGVSAFDTHRTGAYAKPAQKDQRAKPSTRRCLSIKEMLAHGFAAEEPKKDGKVKWYLVAKREALLRAYPRKMGTSESQGDSLWQDEA
jgi:ATP phosphoribosyltransferase regulatory subunit HisZ